MDFENDSLSTTEESVTNDEQFDYTWLEYPAVVIEG